ncbi:hypothetical protein [Streptomyces sp. NPDC094049]|uniref:hypothetical protein n=1 Tax=Streptomyces sp. NPDC094049 TaxID=3154987 RepID=UPI00331CBBA7
MPSKAGTPKTRRLFALVRAVDPLAVPQPVEAVLTGAGGRRDGRHPLLEVLHARVNEDDPEVAPR